MVLIRASKLFPLWVARIIKTVIFFSLLLVWRTEETSSSMRVKNLRKVSKLWLLCEVAIYLQIVLYVHHHVGKNEWTAWNFHITMDL